jgi:starvation-inducible DNA-binding protein
LNLAWAGRSKIQDLTPYLAGVRKGRDLADEQKDQDTVDLLTGIIVEFEKNAWFLRASLES